MTLCVEADVGPRRRGARHAAWALAIASSRVRARAR